VDHEEMGTMKERVRRILIFGAIVGAGTLLIFIDLPLLLILPLVIAISFVLLILLGALPLSDLKGLFRKKSSVKTAAAEPGKKADTKAPAGPDPIRKKRFSLSLPSFFKGKGAGKQTSPAPPTQKTVSAAEPKKSRFSRGLRSIFRRKPEAEKTAPAPAAVSTQDTAATKKKGLSLHMSSFVSSFRQFGAMVTTRKKADPDKLKKIDNLLDAAVHDKLESPPPSSTLSPEQRTVASGGTAPAAAAVAGGALADVPAEEDPFLSLANDELDTSLLEGLDDDDSLTIPSMPETGGESAEFTVTLPGDDIATADAGGAPLSPEMAAAADDILKANEGDAGELPALEGLEAVDEGLGDLDSLSLDSVDLEDDDDEDDSPDPATSAPAAAPAPSAPATMAPASAAPATPSVKKGSDQSEMAAFAAASGGDDDMLSSLAADIKTVRKEQDLSLLRELKDFRAPGTTIETELTELYTTLNTAAEKQKKIRPKEGTTRPQAK